MTRTALLEHSRPATPLAADGPLAPARTGWPSAGWSSPGGIDFGALADLSRPIALPEPTGFDDGALIAAQRDLAEVRRRVDAAAATVAAEIERRSSRELGLDGLAQRLGARTSERLVQQLTGSSSREASTLVRIGGLMATRGDDGPSDEAGGEAAPSRPAEHPWLRPIGAAVARGDLSVEAADIIRASLGAPDDAVSIAALADAAEALVSEARVLSLEKLAAHARALRLSLDLDRVAEREEELRSKRYLHLHLQADGMTRLTGLLDPESAAIVTATFDAVTSPRRGGPRFVNPELAEHAAKASADERTTEQFALDAFVELIRVATLADSKVVLGARRPGITLLVTDRDLRARSGIGFIEGQTERVSIATIERHACSTGVIPLQFDDNGEALRLGREQRLFTAKQAIALAARDGGCQFGDCDRPASWCEMHHIDHWHRDRGRTDIDRAVLICRHHHRLVHHQGWEIERIGGVTQFIPPASLDPAQTPVRAVAKSAALERMLAT